MSKILKSLEHFAPTYVQIYEHSPAPGNWKLGNGVLVLARPSMCPVAD